jgi:acetoin utilization deacetylase AcuC-like enzyme
VERVREYARNRQPFDLDTPVSPGSWEAALHSAGGACTLVEELMAGRAPTGFSALRPPGHHAEAKRAMGFCLFANVSIAARHALDSLAAERVFVLDWDVHHGNGTHAIFHSSPEVLFASIHQWPFYPGTGALADAGSGEGEGFTINLPVPAGSGPGEWLGLLEHIVEPAARDFRPDLVLVSAGFDAHRDDPLANCTLDTETFGRMARRVRSLADELGAPAGAVLEGGYDLQALSASVAATMEGLAEGGEAPAAPRGPLVEAAAEQVGRYWPAVRAGAGS